VSVELSPKVKEGRVVFVLIPLLLLNLTLLSLQIEESRGTTLLKKWILVASTPFFDLSSTTSRVVQGAWRNFIWLHGARQENEQLRAAVRDLSLRERALAEAQLENLRLRRLLNLRDTYSLQGVGAHVVGRVPAYLSNVAYVDRGIESGLRADQPVLADVGIVGRVVLVSWNHSQVQLVTNPDASVGAMVERTRSPGVLRGTGNSLLELQYIGNTEQINVGDLVVTSGLDGVYPKGLPVGRVVDSRKGKSVFRSIQVEPFADMVRLEDVLIVTNQARLR
jgi:rod shape-determining protein MreC